MAFAIVTRQKFDDESSSSSSPLLTTFPHTCVPFLESGLHQIQDNQKTSSFPLMATHLPYTSLPESVVTSNCKIVYIVRNFKDVIVSHYHFLREIVKLPLEDAPFEEAFEDFCEGVSCNGPYWDHILGYWKASQERPNIVLLLKYEDMKKDPTNNVKKLAEFIGYPFTIEELKAGVGERIMNFCSFNNLSNLEVNESGIDHIENLPVVENRLYFRLAKDGDWKNYFTDEMEEKIDKLMDKKLSGTGLLRK